MRKMRLVAVVCAVIAMVGSMPTTVQAAPPPVIDENGNEYYPYEWEYNPISLSLPEDCIEYEQSALIRSVLIADGWYLTSLKAVGEDEHVYHFERSPEPWVIDCIEIYQTVGEDESSFSFWYPDFDFSEIELIKMYCRDMAPIKSCII